MLLTFKHLLYNNNNNNNYENIRIFILYDYFFIDVNIFICIRHLCALCVFSFFLILQQ